MARAKRDRVWRPTARVLAFCLTVSAGTAAIAVNLLLIPGPLSQRLQTLFILAVAAAPLLVFPSKAVLTADSLVVRNILVVHRVPLSEISYVTNYGRGSVHLKTVSGQTVQVYAVQTPTLAVMLSRRSRANEFIEAVEDRALSCGAPIDPGRLRRAIGASARTRQDAAPHGIATPVAPPREPAIPPRLDGAGGRHVQAGKSPFPRRLVGPGYRRTEVDELITRIRAALDQKQSPVRPVTAADVRSARLRVTRWGGYDDRAVDNALDRYAEELDQRAL
jgi:DivIVA domain-containing protein